jgi:HSP20 family protein
MKKRDFKFYWEQPEKKTENKVSRKQVHGHEGQHEFTLSLPELGFPSINVVISSMPVDIGETDKEVVVAARLPGYKKSEISLNITETSIEITASKKEDHIERGGHSFRRESSAGSQHMQFTLPARVDPDKARAKLEGGVLTVMMPKLDGGKKKRIDIK